MKKVLVTGNQGYIGSVLTEILLIKGYSVVGLDTAFYEKLYEENQYFKQIVKDIRDVDIKDLVGVDAIIHLAALSNDPLGEFDKDLTRDINFISTVNLVRLAKKAGVRRFIYSSSQSMYGISDTNEEVEEDNSEKNPLTEYAKTKWLAEQEIKKFSSDDFTVVCFRPSTVFGASPALRCDIVFNNLVASGYTTGKIEVRSDGSPWRPVVHVRDVCSAYIAGLEAPKELVANESFNVGIENGNYTVKDLAEAAQRAVGKNCELTFNTVAGKDRRTYRVSFKKILTKLKGYYKPEWNLEKGGRELVELFDKIGFNEEMFKGRKTIRLSQLKHLIKEDLLDTKLHWKKIKLRQAVIVAGGLGSRLQPFTDHMPKPMIEINGKPLLEHLIQLLKTEGIEEIVLCLGYLPEKIKNYFGDGSRLGIPIRYSVGDVSFGSAKRVKHAEELLDEHFLLMYADNYWPLHLEKLRRFYESKNVLMTMTVYLNKDKFTENNVLLDSNGFVRRYDKKRGAQDLNCVDIGFFILNKEVVRAMPDTPSLMIYEIFPDLIERNQLAAMTTDHRYCGLSKIDRLPFVRDFLTDRKIIFLDRDGVINKRPPQASCVTNWEEFNFLPGAKKAISLLTKCGYETYIITSQPFIGKGLMSDEELQKIHLNMIEEIEKEGGQIKAIYTCPHKNEENCECRKPKPGLIFQAQRDNNLNLKNAILIGDDERDIEAALAADIKGILVKSDSNLLEAIEPLL
jgi:D-glycero-D-manno-heptose 1,7-bisphosphate phosphatase